MQGKYLQHRLWWMCDKALPLCSWTWKSSPEIVLLSLPSPSYSGTDPDRVTSLYFRLRFLSIEQTCLRNTCWAKTNKEFHRNSHTCEICRHYQPHLTDNAGNWAIYQFQGILWFEKVTVLKPLLCPVKKVLSAVFSDTNKNLRLKY